MITSQTHHLRCPSLRPPCHHLIPAQAKLFFQIGDIREATNNGSEMHMRGSVQKLTQIRHLNLWTIGSDLTMMKERGQGVMKLTFRSVMTL